MSRSLPTSVRVVTVGHGTASATDFAALLTAAGVSAIVDVRRYPGSRKFPHFGAASMALWLPEAGITYAQNPELGGRRRPSSDMTNGAWRNPQFRAYADHMATEEFASGVGKLLTGVASAPVAVMCSESLWWRCHRRLLADHLQVVERASVDHLFHDGRLTSHVPTPEARIVGGHLTYPVA